MATRFRKRCVAFSEVDEGSYGSTSEYVRDLIRRDHDRRQLREVLLDVWRVLHASGDIPAYLTDESSG